MIEFKDIKKQIRAEGFKPYKGAYYRVVNDVLHKILLRTIPFAQEFDVQFEIIPLCAEITPMDLDPDCLYRLSDLYPPYAWAYGGKYRPTREECLHRVLDALQHQLFPMLLNANSCHGAFPALYDFLYRCEENRLQTLRMEGGQNRAKPFEWRTLWDGNLLYMALKNKDYAYALRSIKQIVEEDEFYLGKYIVERMQEGLPIPEGVLKKTPGLFDQFIWDIEHNVFDYIDIVLEYNEKRSRELLQQTLFSKG